MHPKHQNIKLKSIKMHPTHPKNQVEKYNTCTQNIKHLNVKRIIHVSSTYNNQVENYKNASKPFKTQFEKYNTCIQNIQNSS